MSDPYPYESVPNDDDISRIVGHIEANNAQFQGTDGIVRNTLQLDFHFIKGGVGVVYVPTELVAGLNIECAQHLGMVFNSHSVQVDVTDQAIDAAMQQFIDQQDPNTGENNE